MAGKNPGGADPVLTRLQAGLEHYRRGELDDALRCYAAIPSDHPAFPDALHLAGLARMGKQEFRKAAERIAQAIAIAPNVAIYHVNHANALEAAGNTAEAEGSLRRALGLQPDLVPALFNLGNLLIKAGRDDAAMPLLDRVLVAEPAHLNAWLALGGILLRKRLRVPALQVARKARSLSDDDGAQDLLAEALMANKAWGEALEVVTEGLRLHPENPSLLKQKARCLSSTGCFREALDTFRAASQANPEDPDCATEIARNLAITGAPEESAALLEALVERHPRNARLYSDWLFSQHYLAQRPPDRVGDDHRRWADRLVRRAPPFSHAKRESTGRLRIGYVSEDFKAHSVAWFIEHVLAAHDRGAFEVFAYFVSPDPDSVTARIRAKVDCFREPASNDPEQIAKCIFEDRIDIAVDLAGHTAPAILEAFSMKPAPVQITWLGYPDTTGLAEMDFRICDAVTDPPGPGDTWNSEQALRLPRCFLSYRPASQIPFDPVPPSETSGVVTFGSFNVLSKVSPRCIEAWSRILAGLPSARLLLKTRALREAATQEALLRRFERYGISPARVAFAGDQHDWAEHMARYRRLDIALDPFPYNGTTTTCEALWMGIPVIGLLGDRHVSRVGASLLAAAGHPDLVANDLDAYVRLAVDLARDPAALAGRHRTLKAGLKQSALCDVEAFTRALEHAYRTAWETTARSSGPAGDLS